MLRANGSLASGVVPWTRVPSVASTIVEDARDPVTLAQAEGADEAGWITALGVPAEVAATRPGVVGAVEI